MDRPCLARQLDAEHGQAPEDRRDRAVDERKFVAQEILFGRENLGARQDALLEGSHGPGNGLAVGALQDLLGERVPVLLDAKEREPELRARHGIHGHQRRVRKPLVEIFDDDARVVENEVAIDERRHAVVRIEVEEVFGQVAVIDIDDIDVDALLGEHEPRAMTPGISRFRK